MYNDEKWSNILYKSCGMKSTRILKCVWQLFIIKHGRVTMKLSKLYNTLPNSEAPWTRTRSSRPDVFCKRGLLRNFAKFKGKHLCQSIFFNKVTDQSLFLIKLHVSGLRKLWHRCFLLNFAKFL